MRTADGAQRERFQHRHLLLLEFGGAGGPQYLQGGGDERRLRRINVFMPLGEHGIGLLFELGFLECAQASQYGVEFDAFAIA